MATINVITSPYAQVVGGQSATGNIRFIGKIETEGGPTTGDWLVDDVVEDKYGALWRCVVAGSPGTWWNMAPGFQDQVGTDVVEAVSRIATGGPATFELSGTPKSLPVYDGSVFPDPAGSTWSLTIGHGTYQTNPDRKHVLATYTGVSGNTLTGCVTVSGEAESVDDGEHIVFTQPAIRAGTMRIPNGIITGSAVSGRAHDLVLTAAADNEREFPDRADYDVIVAREAGSFGHFHIQMPVRFDVDTDFTDGAGSVLCTFAGSRESARNVNADAGQGKMLPTGTIACQARLIGALGSNDALVFQNRDTALARIQFENSDGTTVLYTDETGVQIPNNTALRFGATSGATPYVYCDNSSRVTFRVGAGGFRFIDNAFVNELFGVSDDGVVKINNGPTINTGAGSPESVVTAPEGSLYLRTDGGSGTSLYVKELPLGATGATGWTNLGNSGGQPTAFFSATERADANFPATGELDSGHAYSVANNGSQGFYTVGGELRSDVSLAYLNFGLDAPVRSCYLDVTWTDDGEADDEIAVLIVADGLFAQAVGDYADSGAHILIRRNKWTYQVRRADGNDTTTLADYTYDEPLSYGVRHRIGFTFDGTTCTMIMPDTSTYEVPFDADIANWWGNYACVELVASASGQNKVGINTFTFSSIVDAEPALPAEFQPALRQATGTTKKTVGADVALTPTLQTVFTMEFVVPPSKMVGCNAQFQVDVADDGITTGQLTVENNPTSTVSARLTDHVAWKGMLNIVGVLDCSDFPVGVRRSIWLRLANDGTGTYKESNAQLPTMMLVDLTQGLFP